MVRFVVLVNSVGSLDVAVIGCIGLCVYGCDCDFVDYFFICSLVLVMLVVLWCFDIVWLFVVFVLNVVCALVVVLVAYLVVLAV